MASTGPIKIDNRDLIRSIKDLTDSVKKHTRVMEENNRLRKAELNANQSEVPSPPEGDGS